MTYREDHYRDPLGETTDAGRKRLIQDLNAVYRESPPVQMRASIARRLDEHAAGLAEPQPRATRVPRPGRARWPAVGAAAVLALGGLLGFYRLQTPGAVSAAVILRRALANGPSATPDQALHETGTLYLNGPFDLPDQQLFTPPVTLQVDQWTQLDGTGAVSRQVTTFATGDGTLVARGLQAGVTEQIYGTLGNEITTEDAPSQGDYLWLANPLGIGDVPALLSAAKDSATGTLRLLPQQTRDGSLVDVVRIQTSPDAGSANFPHPVASAGGTAQLTTMYVDAENYAMRGVDVSILEASGAEKLEYSLRLNQMAIVTLAAVPAATFTLGAPPSARSLPSLQHAPEQSAPAQPRTGTPQASLLLGQAPTGLQLGQLNHSAGGLFASTSISYCGGDGHCDRQLPNATQFVITFAQTKPPSAHLPSILAMGQPLSLSIAGQPVQAYYLNDAAQLGGRRLIYHQGDTTIELYSQGLSRSAFFDAVGTLVDAGTHGDLVPAKWRQDGAFGSP